MSTPKKMWMIKALYGNYLFEEYHNKNIVAIGYGINKDLSFVKGIEEIKQFVKETEPNYSLVQISVIAGQINRFRFNLQKGDYVVTDDNNQRNYLVGEIIGDYEYNESLIEDYYHTREVKWLSMIQRERLSTLTRNSMGVIMTIFEIPEGPKKEIISLLEKSENFTEVSKYPEIEFDEKAELELIKMDIICRANEFIKDRILKLSKNNIKNLIAGILRGMGYKTRIVSQESDIIHDIEAYSDKFGLERIIKVKIKHLSNVSVSKEEITNLIKSLKEGDKGMYISTADFYKDSKYEKELTRLPISLINLESILEFLIQYYDNFDIETKMLIPLTKIYLPV